MLVTDRVDVAEKVRLLRSHGMTSLTWDRHHGHASSYDVVDLGYNYRIDELRSALGLAQLKKLVANNARRKAITERYWRALDGSGVELPFSNTLGAPAYHIRAVSPTRSTLGRATPPASKAPGAPGASTD